MGERGIRKPERERLGVGAFLQADRRNLRGRRDRTPLPYGQRLGGVADVLERSIERTDCTRQARPTRRENEGDRFPSGQA